MPVTVYETVYKTLAQTFDGEVAGYSTQVIVEKTTEASTKATDAPATGTAATSADADSVLPGSIVATAVTGSADATAFAIATSPATPTTQITAAGNAAVASQSSSAAAASSTSSSSTGSSGDSTAEKAGVAIGVLGGILVIALLVYFLFTKRRKDLEKEKPQDAEKRPSTLGSAGDFDIPPAAPSKDFAAPNFAGSHAQVSRERSLSNAPSVQTTRTTATAPRLSLRPVTQFLPEFGVRRSSKGAAMALALTTGETHTPVNRQPATDPWDRPVSAESDDDNENPFGSWARRIDSPDSEQVSPISEYGVNPFEAPENVVGVATTTDRPVAVSSMGTGPIPRTMARKQSMRGKDVPAGLTLTKANALPGFSSQPSPTGTEFSFTSVATGHVPGPSKSAMAIAAAGGPATSTVHRVQIDYRPTLDDEMELYAGQLVRLLHEFDDGWALAIRLDRSHQGIVPRLALSTRPVKPRSAGAAPGPRNTAPRNGPPRGPNFNPGQGPMAPHDGPMHSRPGTAGGRKRSPTEMSRNQSPGSVDNRSMRSGPSRERESSQDSASARQPSGSRIPGPSPMRPTADRPEGHATRGRQGSTTSRKPVPGQAY